MWYSWNLAQKFGKSNTTITLPAFNIPGIVWTGASIILTEFSQTAVEDFTLHFPLRANSTFCLAIRWLKNGLVVRRKLWEGIGEKLSYPLYSGELIGAAHTLEIWSVEGKTTALLEEATAMTTGILNDPLSCCLNSVVDIIPTQNAKLFYPYPYVFGGDYYETYQEI